MSLKDLKITKECCDWLDPIMKQHKFSDTSYEQSAVDNVLNKVMMLEKAALAYQKLSICYRVGSQPSEKLMKDLEKANKLLER